VSKERRFWLDGILDRQEQGGEALLDATWGQGECHGLGVDDQPKSFLHVDQAPSPLASFETEIGSVRCGGSEG